MHRIGGIHDNCKCLWIQVDTEPAGVQLLLLGLKGRQAEKLIAVLSIPGINAGAFRTILVNINPPRGAEHPRHARHQIRRDVSIEITRAKTYSRQTPKQAWT
jgi:hypothetical protein